MKHKPTLKQILDAQIRQLLFGKSHLRVAKGLLDADPVILMSAPTFFGLTRDGSLDLAQMVLARLYDRTPGAVTIPMMLKQARQEIGSFFRGDRAQITQAIYEAEQTVLGLSSVLSSIKTRRDKWLAQLDPGTVRDPAGLAIKAQLSIPDLDRAFHDSEQILRDMSSLYEGVIGKIESLGQEDYEQALDWIRKAKCEYIGNFEKEFGPAAWTGPKPKKFTTDNFKML